MAEHRDNEVASVTTPPEPTLEQMENVACALGFAAILHARRAPHYRESLANLHRLVQRSVEGDVEAEASLEALRRVFGSPE